METGRNWIAIKVNKKLAGISMDYGLLAEIAASIERETRIKQNKSNRKTDKNTRPLPYSEICAKVVSLEEVWELRNELKWEDLLLFGTPFQKRIWKKLFDLTHSEDGGYKTPALMSYTEFASLCGCPAGVRAVAHAVALNPVAALIPCHLIIPKEAMERINEICTKAESTIFKGEDLSIEKILNDSSIDFGEYALGKEMKRTLIIKEMKEVVLTDKNI